MSTLELKEKIFQKLESADDAILKEILGIIELDELENDVLKIPEEHKRDIEIGLAQIKNGQTVTNEEVNRKVGEWLSM